MCDNERMLSTQTAICASRSAILHEAEPCTDAIQTLIKENISASRAVLKSEIGGAEGDTSVLVHCIYAY